MPLPQSEGVDVGAIFSAEGQKQYHNMAKTFGAGLSDVWALVRKLLAMNLVADALNILEMWTNDSRYTLAQFKGAIRDVLAKLGINSIQPESNRSVGNLLINDEQAEGEAKMAMRKPSADEVIRHLEGKKVSVVRLQPQMTWALVSLATEGGLPCIELLAEKIAERQEAFERLTFANLV